MNLEDMRKRTARIVGFKSDTADQDFTGSSANDVWEKVDDAINEALFDEWSEAQQEAGYKGFQCFHELTWPASQVTLQIPEFLQQQNMVAIWDITNSVRGDPLWLGDRLSDGTVAWKDHRTLEWGDVGPGQATTLLITYVAQPSELTEATQEPGFFPNTHHHLIPWCAAIILREMADEKAPSGWEKRANRIRQSLWKAMSVRQPFLTGDNPQERSLADYYGG